MDFTRKMRKQAGWWPRPADPVSHYALDLDASERHTRFGGGSDMFPHPPLTGALSGFLPMYDTTVWGMGYGKAPSGPGPGSQPPPVNLQWQMIIPGMQKVT
jgi:hypothetical protein